MAQTRSIPIEELYTLLTETPSTFDEIVEYFENDDFTQSDVAEWLDIYSNPEYEVCSIEFDWRTKKYCRGYRHDLQQLLKGNEHIGLSTIKVISFCLRQFDKLLKIAVSISNKHSTSIKLVRETNKLLEQLVTNTNKVLDKP